MKAPAHRKNRLRVAATVGPVPQIIARIPHPYPSSPVEFGALITDELLDIWIQSLSKRETLELQSWPSISATASQKLDALILKQAETFGWRLALSTLVHRRFEEWDHKPDGPLLFGQYGKALTKCARIFQKRQAPPIDDPDLYRAKEETVVELRLLVRSLRNSFSQKGCNPSVDELIDYVRHESGHHPHLNANIASWLQYFRLHPTSIKLLLSQQRTSPAALFDEWLAWSKGLEPETVRQKISELSGFQRHQKS
jgi:hypothetical protein